MEQMSKLVLAAVDWVCDRLFLRGTRSPQPVTPVSSWNPERAQQRLDEARKLISELKPIPYLTTGPRPQERTQPGEVQSVQQGRETDRGL